MTASTAPGIIPPLKQIGVYRILGLLGQGGMGTVYRAEDPGGRTVAVKLIKTGFETREVLARFQLEQQALGRMDHPNIARCLDAGTSEIGRPYFVMEYVPGQPITRFADEQRLSIPHRLELFIGVCSAIGHANKNGIIHRDIKPGNVLALMQDDRPQIKVIDFGVAKALNGDPSASLTLITPFSLPIGSYEYMSPEQAERIRELDVRSDVYSLGVLLYELLAGVPPLDRDKLIYATEKGRMRMRLRRRPNASDRLRTSGEANILATAECRQMSRDDLIRQLDHGLDWIPDKAMRRHREDRYNSAQELTDDIQNYLAGRTLLATTPTQIARMWRFLTRLTGIVS